MTLVFVFVFIYSNIFKLFQLITSVYITPFENLKFSFLFLIIYKHARTQKKGIYKLEVTKCDLFFKNIYNNGTLFLMFL
jgi:hypothetical protein